MTLTVRELLLAVESGALERLLSQGIPTAGAWKIRRLLRLVRAEYADAQATRNKMFTEANSLPVKDQPDSRFIKPECVAAFQADPFFSELVEITCDPITLDDVNGASISVMDLEKLGPLVAE